LAARWLFVFLCALSGLYAYRIIRLFFTVLRLPERREN
jgi:hypothetical protein